jgi:putative oxidoreductase
MVDIKTNNQMLTVTRLLRVLISQKQFDIVMLVFRVTISSQLMITHGLKKIGLGLDAAEVVPNPLHLPVALNQYFALSANLIFPVFVMVGFLTRLTVLPILAVTFTGYFVVHLHDSLLVKDVPFMYSTAFLLILALGPGRISIDRYISNKIQQ